MSQLFNQTLNTNSSDNSTQKGQSFQAYDDVRRVAQKTPALFRINKVPSVTNRAFKFSGM